MGQFMSFVARGYASRLAKSLRPKETASPCLFKSYRKRSSRCGLTTSMARRTHPTKSDPATRMKSMLEQEFFGIEDRPADVLERLPPVLLSGNVLLGSRQLFSRRRPCQGCE